MQPVLTQVPPKRPRSMTATFMPACDSRPARGGPACPVPITIASNLVVMSNLPIGMWQPTAWGPSGLRAPRVRPLGVVGIHLSVRYHSIRTPDIARGHRQGPARVCVDGRAIVLEESNATRLLAGLSSHTAEL